MHALDDLTAALAHPGRRLPRSAARCGPVARNWAPGLGPAAKCISGLRTGGLLLPGGRRLHLGRGQRGSRHVAAPEPAPFPTAGCCSMTSRSGSGRGRRWRWSARTVRANHADQADRRRRIPQSGTIAVSGGLGVTWRSRPGNPGERLPGEARRRGTQAAASPGRGSPARALLGPAGDPAAPDAAGSASGQLDTGRVTGAAPVRAC